jgi:hypothetical protein
MARRTVHSIIMLMVKSSPFLVVPKLEIARLDFDISFCPKYMWANIEARVSANLE